MLHYLRTRNTIILHLLLFIPAAYSGQSNRFDRQNEKTQKIAERFIKKHDIPGMAVSVSYMGDPIFSKGFGYADIKNKISADPARTKFRIASITKMITALTLLKMAENNSLNIDNTPQYYLENLPKKKYDFTLRQLAGHLSGLKRNPGRERWDEANNFSEKDFYEVFGSEELEFSPGSDFLYSNYGFKLLGLVIEKKCGKPIDECQNEYVIRKLNMENTTIDEGKEYPDAAVFYHKNKGNNEVAPYMDCKFKYAQGCHLSTSEDLLKLGNAFLYPSRIFSSNNFINTAVKSQTLFSGAKTGYGIGVMTSHDFYGNYFFGHNGMENGARSLLRVYPKQKLTIAVLVNSEETALEELVTEIMYNYMESLK